MTFEDPTHGDEADRIREQLKALEHERMRLEARLREIEHGKEQLKVQRSPLLTSAPAVTSGSHAADKVAFFR
jgi:phage shock protein A